MRGGTAPRGFFREGGVSSGGEGLRRRFERIVERAAEAGFPNAARLCGLTPAEIELEMRAFSAREQRRWERLDAAAWLAARYATIGWHAPKRFPKRPEGVKRKPKAMKDAAMKDVFVQLAAKRR